MKVKKDVEPHLKTWLLQGKSITHNQAQKMWRTNRLAEYVRRLREKGMNIDMKMATHDDDTFGVYSLRTKKKVSRIQSREYVRV